VYDRRAKHGGRQDCGANRTRRRKDVKESTADLAHAGEVPKPLTEANLFKYRDPGISWTARKLLAAHDDKKSGNAATEHPTAEVRMTTVSEEEIDSLRTHDEGQLEGSASDNRPRIIAWRGGATITISLGSD